VADGGRRCAVAVAARGQSGGVDQLEPLHLEPELRTHLREQGHVAAPVVAEVEVVAHDHDLGVEPIEEHLAHEVLRRLLRPHLVERDHEAEVDAGLGQQLQLLREVGEQPRRGGRPHDRRRVPVEGDDGGAQPLGLGSLSDGGDDRLVAEVDAVVGADGDDAALGRSRAGIVVAHDLHRQEATRGPRRRAQPTA
jgi:hypothetical protein